MILKICPPFRQERLDSRKKRMATNRTDEDTSEKARVEVDVGGTHSWVVLVLLGIMLLPVVIWGL